jgi:RNA polymerase sigma-70 factor, ECF subfamily
VSETLDKAYELTLVLRSQIGDERAFEELLARHSAPLRFYVTKMLRDLTANADDVLQDTWLSAHRALPKLEDAGAFRAWLYRIARDRVCREFRRRRVEFCSSEELAEMEAPVPESAIDVELMRERLELLSCEHREVLLLRFMQDLDYEEIARVTGSTVGTVRSRIHYAKRALRRAYQQTAYGTE